MKKIATFYILIMFMANGCQGQPTKKQTTSKKDELTTFEQKQKNVLASRSSITANPQINTYNYRYAAQKATPGVVHIKSYFTSRTKVEVPEFFRDFFDEDFFRHFFDRQDQFPKKQMGSASGVIVSDDGYIVTNNHVVAGADTIEVVLHDRRSYKAKIVGTDPATDLALLKIDEKKLDFIEFGNSDSVEVGDIVLAVGNPFNLASTVTSGIVSAKARNINILQDRSAVESYIQTDAAVNPGNSGGALVDINGRLIGINSAIATPTGSYAGYSFAIPIEIIKKTINDLLHHGKIMRGYLGIFISGMDGDKAKQMGIKKTSGVLVDSLVANSAASKAGIKKNDIISNVDNHVVETVPQLLEIIARHRPGEKIKIVLFRNGEEKTVSVTLLGIPNQETTSDPLASELLNKLGIEIENLSEDEKKKLNISGGVKVNGISRGIIQSQTNMQEGFIIMKVNRKPIYNKDEIIRELKDKKGGILLEGIYTNPNEVYYYAFGL